MHRLHRRVAPLLAAVSVFLVGPAQAASSPSPNPSSTTQVGGIGDPSKRSTFGVQAASGKGLDSRPYLIYDVTPGAQLNDHIAVVNYSLQPLRVQMYATDAINDDRGGFALKKGDERATDAGSWIGIGTPGGTGFVTVPKRSNAILPIHLQVPSTATPGDHVAGVLASLSTISKDKNGVNVRLDQRVAARVYIRVSGALRPQVIVERIHATYHDNWNPLGRGSATVSYRVRNTGNVKLGGKPRVSVNGPFGLTHASAPVPEIPLLFPGNYVDLTTQVHSVIPFVWEHAEVRVAPTMLVGDLDPGLKHAYTGGTHFWAVPWVLIGMVLVLTYLWRRLRKRRAKGGGPKHGKGGTEPKVPTPPPASAEAVLAPVGDAAPVGIIDEGGRQ